MTTTDDFDVDDRLANHLRHALRTFAQTVPDDLPEPQPARTAGAQGKRMRRAAVVLASLGTVAACGAVALHQLSPGEIERIPTEAALMEGTSTGMDWWLIPSAAIRDMPACNPPLAAVELVSEDSNKPGHEWNTGGVIYGEVDEPTRADSCYDEAAWLANPPMFDMGATRLGDNDDPDSAWGYFATVHPTIARVDVVADDQMRFSIDTKPLPERPDGPRFAAFTVAPDTRTVTVRLLTTDGTVIIEETKALPVQD